MEGVGDIDVRPVPGDHRIQIGMKCIVAHPRQQFYQLAHNPALSAIEKRQTLQRIGDGEGFFAERSGRGGRRSAKAANLPIEHFAPVRFVIPDLPHQGGIVVRHRLGAGECNLRPGTFGFKQLVEHQQQFVATGIANVDVVRFGGAKSRSGN